MKVLKTILIISTILLALTTCKKDPQPIMERFDLSREDLTVGTTSASIVGTYAYSGTIDEITVCVSEDGVHPAEFVADINGKSFAVEMTGLRPATSYQYYYSVYYGFSKPFTTEAKTFTTLSESPTVRTIDVISIDSTAVRVNCETVSDGGVEITERGVCWNTYGNPNLDDSNVAYSSGGLGEYSCRIGGLSPSTRYYVRAYAKNASGIGFGEVMVFLTDMDALLPSVTTEQVSNITQTTAMGGGNVLSEGSAAVIERGICWGTSHNPTISGSHAYNGTGTGSYTVNMTGLTANTTYYVRAYAINSAGTSYGSEVSFTTLSSGGGHTYVDLGLPSGLLWATCNVGADSPEEYGDYFAWGETQPKSDYSSSTYQYCMGSSTTLTKYCTDASYGYYGFTDNLTTLQPSDDAATAQWGSGWRMPTKEECQELLNNTTHVWTTQNGVNGRLFTATNGNSLFLPAAGYRGGTSLHGAGTSGYYWSSSLDTDNPIKAWYPYFGSGGCNVGNGYRFDGQSVRPVRSASKN